MKYYLIALLFVVLCSCKERDTKVYIDLNDYETFILCPSMDSNNFSFRFVDMVYPIIEDTLFLADTTTNELITNYQVYHNDKITLIKPTNTIHFVFFKGLLDLISGCNYLLIDNWKCIGVAIHKYSNSLSYYFKMEHCDENAKMLLFSQDYSHLMNLIGRFNNGETFVFNITFLVNNPDWQKFEPYEGYVKKRIDNHLRWSIKDYIQTFFRIEIDSFDFDDLLKSYGGYVYNLNFKDKKEVKLFHEKYLNSKKNK